MPSGHTNKDTINQRRPISKAMFGLLKDLNRYGGHKLAGMNHRIKNSARALVDRGLATHSEDGKIVRITTAGLREIGETPMGGNP